MKSYFIKSSFSQDGIILFRLGPIPVFLILVYIQEYSVQVTFLFLCCSINLLAEDKDSKTHGIVIHRKLLNCGYRQIEANSSRMRLQKVGLSLNSRAV